MVTKRVIAILLVIMLFFTSLSTVVIDEKNAFAATEPVSSADLEFLTEPIYDAIGSISDGLIRVRQGNNIGFIDESGKTVIADALAPLRALVDGAIDMDRVVVDDFHEGYALVGYNPNSSIFNDYAYFIDKTGNVPFNIAYPHPSPNYYGTNGEGSDVSPFISGYYSVFYPNADSNIYFFNNNGELVGEFYIFPNFPFYWNKFNDNLMPFSRQINDEEGYYYGDGYGYLGTEFNVDTGVNVAIDIYTEEGALRYDGVRPFHDGFAFAKKDGKWGVINKSGAFVIQPQYEDFFVYDINYSYQVFVNGFACVKKDGKWGFINTSGNTVVPFTYDESLQFFREGLSFNKTYGCIDTSGKTVFTGDFDDVNYFMSGVSLVGKGGEYRFIDTNGNTASSKTWQFETTSVSLAFADYGLVRYSQNGKYGLAKLVNSGGNGDLSIYGYTPANGRTDVLTSSSVSIVFYPTVQSISGDLSGVLLKRYDNDATVPSYVRVVSNSIMITPNAPLDYSTQYYVVMPAATINDGAGNYCPGLQKGDYGFKTVSGASATPVITITTQPASSTTFATGSITGSLSVAAFVTQGATLSYQWYSNTSNSNVGGVAISGATSAKFTIPTNLTTGAYYYFCEVRATGGATARRSNVATVTVNNPVNASMDLSSYFSNSMWEERASVASINVLTLQDTDRQSFVASLLALKSPTEDQIQKVYNLLFKSNYRPNNFGRPTSSWDFPNGTPGSSVLDAGLMTSNVKIPFKEAQGCASYANFARAYISGKSDEISMGSNYASDVTAVRDVLNSTAQIGDAIHYYRYTQTWCNTHQRYEPSQHRVVYLAESSDGTGFYCLSYGGSEDSDIKLEFISYQRFVSSINTYELKKPSIGNIDVSWVNYVIRCPVDVLVSFDGEELNSATGELSASFGTMAIVGVGEDRTIILTLQYGLDYYFEITGTGTGMMSLTVEYNDGSENDNSRQFQDIPISPTTSIMCYDFSAFGDMELEVDHDGNGIIDEIWYAAYNGGVSTAPSQELLETYLLFSNPNYISSADYSDEPSTAGDVNNDGKVDATDLSMLISDFGKSCEDINNKGSDVNGDGKVDATDLSILISNFGK